MKKDTQKEKPAETGAAASPVSAAPPASAAPAAPPAASLAHPAPSAPASPPASSTAPSAPAAPPAPPAASLAPPASAARIAPAAPIVLDEKDKAILQLLQDNAKMTVREIAAKVHLSTTPVHERIRRLEETGVIRQYATLLDHSKVKKGLLAICYVSLKEHNKKSGARFIKTIQDMPEIMECFIISGEFDFLLKVAVENMDAYYDFHVNQLGQIENIGHVQSTFVMGVVKQTHQLIF